MSAIFTAAAGLAREMLAELDAVRVAEYEAASAATRGHMLSRRGLAAGVDSWTVFLGNRAVLAAYGSDELREHLAAHPRTTRAAFEAEWLDARA